MPEVAHWKIYEFQSKNQGSQNAVVVEMITFSHIYIDYFGWSFLVYYSSVINLSTHLYEASLQFTWLTFIRFHPCCFSYLIYSYLFFTYFWLPLILVKPISELTIVLVLISSVKLKLTKFALPDYILILTWLSPRYYRSRAFNRNFCNFFYYRYVNTSQRMPRTVTTVRKIAIKTSI